jgi:hypothetical protein
MRDRVVVIVQLGPQHESSVLGGVVIGVGVAVAREVQLPRAEAAETVSNNVLYIHPLYLSFTVSSKRFQHLYLISLQQRPLNHVLYTQILILKIFFNFIFYTYVFIILSNVLYIF